jgi:hypothetical protein
MDASVEARGIRVEGVNMEASVEARGIRVEGVDVKVGVEAHVIPAMGCLTLFSKVPFWLCHLVSTAMVTSLWFLMMMRIPVLNSTHFPLLNSKEGSIVCLTGTLS